MQDAVNLFVEVVSAVLPYAVAFAVGQRIVTMFLSMAFKGELKI